MQYACWDLRKSLAVSECPLPWHCAVLCLSAVCKNLVKSRDSHTRSEKLGLETFSIRKVMWVPADYLLTTVSCTTWLLSGIILHGILFGSVVDFSMITSLCNLYLMFIIDVWCWWCIAGYETLSAPMMPYGVMAKHRPFSDFSFVLAA